MFRPSWPGCSGVCVFVRVPLLHPLLPGGRLWRGGVRVLSWVGFAPPLPFGVFFSGRHGVSCRGFVVSVAGCPGSGSRGVRPAFPPRSGCAFVCFLFFSPQRGVCRGVPSSGGPLLPVWCCWCLAGWYSGPLGVSSSVPSGWGYWLPFVAWLGGLVAVGLSLAPPPAFLSGGGGLPVPFSAFPGLVHALVGIRCCFPRCRSCLRFARSCSSPMGRVGYVHVGLGSLSWWVRFWLCRLGGCARRLSEALG